MGAPARDVLVDTARPPPDARRRAVGALHVLLHAACPPELEVLLAPFAVARASDAELQPDLLVAPREQFTDRELLGPPLLAVEVLSPSTRRIDVLLKRDRLQEAGCPSYWLVDPDEPSIAALELQDGVYVEIAHITRGQSWTAQQPYAVTVVLAALLP